jgi:nucleoside 2-deoxyribosyltransferase
MVRTMKVYFAHPCFTEDQRQFKKEFLARISAALSETRDGNEISVLDPFDNTPNVEHDTGAKLEMAERITLECIRLLE